MGSCRGWGESEVPIRSPGEKQVIPDKHHPYVGFCKILMTGCIPGDKKGVVCSMASGGMHGYQRRDVRYPAMHSIPSAMTSTNGSAPLWFVGVVTGTGANAAVSWIFCPAITCPVVV